MGNQSLFYPTALIEQAAANAARYPWAPAVQHELIRAAAPFTPNPGVLLP